jgi:hypothetical protein
VVSAAKASMISEFPVPSSFVHTSKRSPHCRFDLKELVRGNDKMMEFCGICSKGFDDFRSRRRLFMNPSVRLIVDLI